MNPILFFSSRFPVRVIAVMLLTMVFTSQASAQKNAKDVFVDKNGVMRWGDSRKEVQGFGVNYTAPFAHAYRSAKKLGVNIEKEIENDVYHFARLGFDAFRVHVWDTEISDSTGNLLENENLRLFDFMLSKMKARGMKMLLTPIAFWGNGWPEPDERTPGFSALYGKDACLTNSAAIAAQERYLFQFLNHVNPYTKLAYKDDPDIVAFEISNEPHHRGTPEEVIRYINRMVDSMRRTGCGKPIFYNVSHSIHLSEAYYKARINGGTFQWYPTGLGAGHELRGNFLPNVDRYVIPFANEKGFKAGAKVVYEFDAADVGRSYIYPAMARSFRTAGIQWATHFAYDPTYLAYANTEYNTHYMNLVYAPQKALSLKIASEVFHRVPMYRDYGRYPDNVRFDQFRVSYEEDLAELVTDRKFIYTNDTKTVPPSPETLDEIAGAGNSAVVGFEGLGAYFLDRIEDGVWRLEILPDAIWTQNLFGRNSLQRTLAVINHRKWPVTITLPDLGDGFSVKPLSQTENVRVNGKTFEAVPGVYLLTRNGVTTRLEGESPWKNIRLGEYAAPASTVTATSILHQPLKEVRAASALPVRATVVSRDAPDSVVVLAMSPRGWRTIAMRKVSGYEYEAQVPADYVQEGFMDYHITVFENGSAMTFPSNVKGKPSDWDFAGGPYRIRVVAEGAALSLFNAASDVQEMSREWRRGTRLMPASDPSKAVLRVELKELQSTDIENLKGTVVKDYSMRYNFAPNVVGRREELKSFSTLVVIGRSIGEALPLQVALVDRSGNAYGSIIRLETRKDRYEIDLRSLRPVKLVSLPRPYPTFLPYFFEPAREAGALDLSTVETVQLSVGPELEREGPYTFEVQELRLEK